jgi:hypothetical protein
MKQLNISQVDALFVNGIYPIEFLFYYRKGFKTKKVRSVLKKLSSDFWPLFGEYRDGQLFSRKYVEEEFYEEESRDLEFEFPRTEADRFQICSFFGQPDLKNFFFLKVVKLKNGLIVIPKMSHLAGDGYSYFYFLTLLSLLSQRIYIPFKFSFSKLVFKPILQRNILKEFSFSGHKPKPLQPAGKYNIQIDEVPKKKVAFFIQEVLEENEIRVSSNDIMSAIAVKKMVKKNPDSFDERLDLTIPIDIRRHLKNFGRRFFGNGLILHHVNLNKNFVIEGLTKDIAMKIREAMYHINEESYLEYLVRLEEKIAKEDWENLTPFDPQKGCLVTNMSRLSGDKIDFGTGPPQLVFPITVEKNAAVVLSNKDNYILRLAY